MAIFRRMSRFGEGNEVSDLTCTIGTENLTYGGWFVPQSAAFLLGTVYLYEDVSEDVYLDNRPESVLHFIESISEDIYEV